MSRSPHKMECEDAAIAAEKAIEALILHLQGRAYWARLGLRFEEAERLSCAAQAIRGLGESLWSIALLLDNPENKATR